MENKRIPSTDPSTWNETFNVGDKVKVRVDFSDTHDTNSIFNITRIERGVAQPMKLDENGNNIGGFMRPENPSGLLYELSNGGTWEGKDLELASGSKAETQTTESQPTQSSMTIKEKIDALQLVPLFPDTNYFVDTEQNANGFKITNDSIAFSYSRPEANLFMTGMMSRKVNSKEYTRLFVVIKENTRVYEDISDDNQKEYSGKT